MVVVVEIVGVTVMCVYVWLQGVYVYAHAGGEGAKSARAQQRSIYLCLQRHGPLRCSRRASDGSSSSLLERRTVRSERTRVADGRRLSLGCSVKIPLCVSVVRPTHAMKTNQRMRALVRLGQTRWRDSGGNDLGTDDG